MLVVAVVILMFAVKIASRAVNTGTDTDTAADVEAAQAPAKPEAEDALQSMSWDDETTTALETVAAGTVAPVDINSVALDWDMDTREFEV